MKGQITITIKDDGRVNFRGNVLLTHNVDKYELISGLAKCLGVNDPESWAKCVLYCLSRINNTPDNFERTEIVLPRKKENNDG